MQVSKWGNCLAVRLPAQVVEALELKEGDQVEIRIAGDRSFEVGRDQSRQRALASLRKLLRPLPPDSSLTATSAGFVWEEHGFSRADRARLIGRLAAGVSPSPTNKTVIPSEEGRSRSE